MLDTLVAAVSPELADAVAIALALDPRDRYQTAREMGRALVDGAGGIAPGERRLRQRGEHRPGDARALGDRPSRWPASRAPRRAELVTPRRPRPAPPGRRAAAFPGARRRAAGAVAAGPARIPRARGPAGAGRRVVAVVFLTAPAPTRIALRNVVYSDVKQTSSALQQLVSENTK